MSYERCVEAFSHLTSAGVTDVGRERATNEDALLLLPEHGVFCVADGMGGMQGGSVASMAAVESINKVFRALADPGLVRTAAGKARLIRQAIEQVGVWLRERSAEKGFSGMGTTVTALVFGAQDPTEALTLHIGDSPAYIWRKGVLKQLTRSHSFAEAVGAEDEGALHPRLQSIITRAVGMEGDVEPEVTRFKVQPGDVFMICSDGLTRMLNQEALATLLQDQSDDDVYAMAGRLVDAANRAGGKDNISVVLVHVGDPPPEITEEEDDTGAEAPDANGAATDTQPGVD